MQYNKIDFSGITDWNQTNEAIAKQLKCCDKSVRNARRARGLPRAPDKSKRSILKAKLKQIGDKAWMTYNNHQIARILKCSVTAVRMYRIIHWKPACELHLKVAIKHELNTNETRIKHELNT